MSETGKYIYGVINSNTNNFFGPRGVKACEKVHFNKNTSKDTKDNRISDGVYTISYKDISAVVSESEIVDYNHMQKDALAAFLVGHQKIIERIMGQGYVIIPMRLGTFAIDEDEVKDVLNKGYYLVKDIIDKINNKIEIDVVVTWSDFNSFLKEAGEKKEIMDFKDKLLSNPKGITIDDQMKVGVMVKNALDEMKGKYAIQIQNNLKSVCDDLREHEVMDDKMVLNCAFLVNKDRQSYFDKKVEELNTKFEEKLNFRCVCPLPPYSFYTLEIIKLQFGEIEWARKKLGLLSDLVTKDEIKKAYKRFASSYHPDKNPDTPNIEIEFDEINKAYNMILDYCLATQQESQGERCSFKEEELKNNAILVKLRE